MNRLLLFASLLLTALLSCRPKAQQAPEGASLDRLATDYVRLGLAIGQHDGDFVDAYYGPDSLRPAGTKQDSFPKVAFLAETARLQEGLKPFLNEGGDSLLRMRARWMAGQLTAFSRRIRWFAGDSTSFEQQATELFGVAPPALPESHFQGLLARLNAMLPGAGGVRERFLAVAGRFVIPKEKLDTVIKASIAESKRQTAARFPLPEGEDFRLEYVTDKPWSGYNWYGGNYKSRIQINTDITTYVDRIIDVAAHEGYPGHHVYNSLLEKNLYRERGWIEISLYPLFSPQSLIAEGSANYGVELAFPGAERAAFLRDRLLPLAGLDTTGLHTYLEAVRIKGALAHARTEVERGLINGTLSEREALRWLTEYALFNEADAARSLAFTRKYGSYVINYTYGLDLVARSIEGRGGTAENPQRRWALFAELLSNPVRPADLLPAQ